MFVDKQKLVDHKADLGWYLHEVCRRHCIEMFERFIVLPRRYPGRWPGSAQTLRRVAEKPATPSHSEALQTPVVTTNTSVSKVEEMRFKAYHYGVLVE